MMDAWFLLEIALANGWSTSSILPIADLPFLKPVWMFWVSLSFSTNNYSRFAIILSRIFDRHEISEIGWYEFRLVLSVFGFIIGIIRFFFRLVGRSYLVLRFAGLLFYFLLFYLCFLSLCS